MTRTTADLIWQATTQGGAQRTFRMDDRRQRLIVSGDADEFATVVIGVTEN